MVIQTLPFIAPSHHPMYAAELARFELGWVSAQVGGYETDVGQNANDKIRHCETAPGAPFEEEGVR